MAEYLSAENLALQQTLLAQVAPEKRLNKAYMQDTLCFLFKFELFSRPEHISVEQVVQAFGERHSVLLNWLGEKEQDEILREAERQSGIDLSRYYS